MCVHIKYLLQSKSQTNKEIHITKSLKKQTKQNIICWNLSSRIFQSHCKLLASRSNFSWFESQAYILHVTVSFESIILLTGDGRSGTSDWAPTLPITFSQLLPLFAITTSILKIAEQTKYAHMQIIIMTYTCCCAMTAS
jgi:hypothetical protein